AGAEAAAQQRATARQKRSKGGGVIVFRPSLQGIPFNRFKRGIGKTKRLRLCGRRSEYRRRQNGQLGIPFHARRRMGGRASRLRNNSCNQGERCCDRDPIATKIEQAAAAKSGHRQSACLPADESSPRKRQIL